MTTKPKRDVRAEFAALRAEVDALTEAERLARRERIDHERALWTITRIANELGLSRSAVTKMRNAYLSPAEAGDRVLVTVRDGQAPGVVTARRGGLYDVTLDDDGRTLTGLLPCALERYGPNVLIAPAPEVDAGDVRKPGDEIRHRGGSPLFWSNEVRRWAARWGRADEDYVPRAGGRKPSGRPPRQRDPELDEHQGDELDVDTHDEISTAA